MAGRQAVRKVTFGYAIRSFTGYLEGTGKSAHTIANYRQDLGLFERFMSGSRTPSVRVDQLTLHDLRAYAQHLRAQGFHDNTRRRRLLTVRRFFEYLTRRGRISVDLAKRVPAPHKVERVPHVLDAGELVDRILALPSSTLLEARNRVLLRTLAETGCLVSEVARLEFGQFDLDKGELEILSVSSRSAPRRIPVSQGLVAEVASLRERSTGKYLFLGFNRFGPMTATPMTPRGVELLVKAHAGVTPRTIRHSVVVGWARRGVEQARIKEWLGLRTDYAFRAYAPLFKSSAATTSTSRTRPARSEERQGSGKNR